MSVRAGRLVVRRPGTGGRGDSALSLKGLGANSIKDRDLDRVERAGCGRTRPVGGGRGEGCVLWEGSSSCDRPVTTDSPSSSAGGDDPFVMLLLFATPGVARVLESDVAFSPDVDRKSAADLSFCLLCLLPCLLWAESGPGTNTSNKHLVLREGINTGRKAIRPIAS